MRLRDGHTLAEALCALALGGVVAAAAGLMLGSARRALEQAEEHITGGRAEREAVAIVRKAMATGDAIVLHGDTAVELDLLIGVSLLCGVETRALLLPPQRTSGSASLTALPQLPARDDIVLVRQFDGTPESRWWHAALDSVIERRIPGQCTASDGWRAPVDSAARLLRLVVSDSIPAEFAPGSEVRILRRGRFALYPIGGDEWALGWRRCHPFSGACGTIQPLASPLRSPGASGFRVAAQNDAAVWTISASGIGGRGAEASLPW